MKSRWYYRCRYEDELEPTQTLEGKVFFFETKYFTRDVGCLVDLFIFFNEEEKDAIYKVSYINITKNRLEDDPEKILFDLKAGR